MGDFPRRVFQTICVEQGKAVRFFSLKYNYGRPSSVSELKGSGLGGGGGDCYLVKDVSRGTVGLSHETFDDR